MDTEWMDTEDTDEETEWADGEGTDEETEWAETEWAETEWAEDEEPHPEDDDQAFEDKPPPPNLPKISAATLAAVRALQAGEVEESARHLFETYESNLRSYFRRHGCLKEEADDLTQNVFLQVLEQIGALKDATRFHFWLFKIAGNYLRNSVRDNKRGREAVDVLAEKARGESESGAFWMRGTFEPNPEAKLVMSETVDERRLTLRQLLQVTRLAPRSLQSLVRRLQGESYGEIARGLGIAEVTVRSHICRASATLLRNLDKIDLTLADVLLREDDDVVAHLSPEVLTFKREALEADPAYFKAGILEAASAEYAEAEEVDEALALRDEIVKHKDDEVGTIQHAVASPAGLADVIREEQARGRPRRRGTRTILPAEALEDEPTLAPLDRDGLAFPVLLLEEAVALLDGSRRDRDLAVKAKLTCAGALLDRGRRFPIARQVGELVRLAVLHLGSDKARQKIVEGRDLLRSYLGHDQKTTHSNSRRNETCQEQRSHPSRPAHRAQPKEATGPSMRRYASAR